MTRTTGSPTPTHDQRLNDHPPIPIPWRVRWVRFRHQLLPVLTLILCAIVAGWLWYNQTASGNTVGAVEIVRMPVSSAMQGTLAYLPGKQVQHLDKVNEGDVVAVLEGGDLQTRRKAAQAELDDLRRQEKANPGAADLRDRVAGKEQELAEIGNKIDLLQLRSPLSGTVMQVHRRPGQAVQPGEPIMEIGSDKGTAVVAYLRQEQQQINPTKGMAVDVHLHRRPPQTVEGKVDSVGGQVESVPSRQLRDQKVPEWGLPVRVTVSPDSGVELKPGEVVTLHFKPGQTGHNSR